MLFHLYLGVVSSFNLQPSIPHRTVRSSKPNLWLLRAVWPSILWLLPIRLYMHASYSAPLFLITWWRAARVTPQVPLIIFRSHTPSDSMFRWSPISKSQLGFASIPLLEIWTLKSLETSTGFSTKNSATALPFTDFRVPNFLSNSDNNDHLAILPIRAGFSNK